MKIENYLLNIILFIIRIVSISFKKNENSTLLVLIPNHFRMKKQNVFKVIFFFGIVAFHATSYGQNFKPFTARFNQQIKGDMLVVGNSILGSAGTVNNNSVNEAVAMQLIDIDGDPTTFSSSSANLAVPPATTCFRIAYAGLYWGALIKTGDSRANIRNVKFKLPGSTTYTPITGTLIYDAVVAPIVPDSNKPYACYADVTSLLSGLTNSQGTYTVADVASSIGLNGSTGLSAGWTLVVVYEDPTTTTKSITTFDGFSHIFDSSSLDINVSGFITPPSGSVDIKFGFAALNGDRTATTKVEVGNSISNGDPITTTQRPSNSFFNSSITDINGYITARNPNVNNTLGYDTGTVEQKDAKKVGNNATSAVVSLQIPKGQANSLYSFFNSFLINVVAPDISLTKIVENAAGQDVGNTTINLGQDLYYKIDFQNIGNDQITAFTLEDVLPKNVIFNFPADVTSLPTGMTISNVTYNAATRRLVFTIPDGIVNIGDPINTIRLHVKVVSDVNLLSDACSNEIKNQAFANYRGVVNTTPIVGEGSFASTVCNFGSPSSTNFLANINGVTFTRTQVLCGNSVVLSASNGYDSYSWSTSPTGSPVVSTSQTFTATSTGTYYVNSVSSGTCRSIKEEVTVIPFGNTITNPVSPYADVVPKCPNNGKDLPNIFLCGATATRLIQTNITDASSIEWQKLNEAICPSTAIANCANESFADSCWNTVATGQNYSADTAGQFRVVLKYPGGCQSIFYFNVYKNTLAPTVTTNDIICTTSGNITVGGVPSGYEYSLDNITYQPSNIFTINTAGTYTVYIKQIGVITNPCVFQVQNILIRLRNFTVQKITTQPLCNGGLGSIRLVANDVRPQYFFSLTKGGTLVNSVGPILANESTFSNLSAGTYTYEVRTEDGCIETGNIDIINPPALTATSALTKPLTCANGEITVYPVGGTAPYRYFVNSTTVSQTLPQIVVSKPLPAGGVFNITVTDANNCSTTTSITVAEVPKPVYTVTKTDINCYGVASGEIRFNVTSANGYSLRYSINNGTSFSTNPTFSNLPAGTYTPVLEYSLSGQVCTEAGTPITIVEPASAVTASGGVSKLAGCTLSNQGGTIRFSNVSGGTPGYTYSFDGGATFGTATEKDVLPGSYTLVVRDSRGCTFTIPYPVVLDPIPTAPSILVDTASFNCDGTGTTTVTVTNPSNLNYTYEYLIDGVLNPNTADPKVFLNVPSGSHVITVRYKLVSVSTFSTLLEENFGSGNPTTTPGIASAYCFNDQRIVGPYPCGQRSVEDNEYSVASFFWRSDDPSSTNVGAWFNFKDHTTNGTDPKGRFLLVNIGNAAGNYGVLYSKPIVDVIPNQPLNVEVYLANLLRAGVNGANPDFIIELVDPLGNVVASQFTGVIAGSTTSPDRNKWVFKQLSLNPGNNTNLTFRIKSGSILYNGNDALIDDIRVYQLPETCIAQKDFPIDVPTGKAFEAQIAGSKNITCFGLTNGEITITAQNFSASTGFQYSTNNGSTWFTSLTSPVTITGLAAGTYAVLVRPNASSAAVCTKTFSVPITAPTAVTASASIILQATCSTGATIRAVGGGGTPAYQYELRQANGTTVVTAFNNNPDFTNVPVGSYTVFVRDANGCTNATGVPITVNAPPTLTATLDATTDYCYTVANPATLVVNVSGGVGPFTYALDSNAAISSALTTFSFANVTPGTHTIVVTDSNNCTSTIPNIVIAPAVAFNVSLLQDLTCLVDASIGNPVITGGYGTPYTYTVSYNSGTPTAVASFPYTATLPGTYVFTVTDSRGCPATSNTITVTPKTAPTHTTVKTDITCNGLNNGTITVTASGGFTTTYTYAIKLTSVATYTTQTTNQFTGLAAGTYDIKVIDSKGCESSPTQVTIINPTPIAANATATAFTCNSTTNANQSATITVLPTGGTGTYTYSYNNGATYGSNSTLTVNDNGLTQTFQIIVQDANGCLSPVQTITLAPLNKPTDLTFLNAAVTCTATTTTVSVTAINGVGALTFLITGTTSATAASNFGPITTAGSSVAADFPNLLPGNYTFRVTDANGCFYSESYTVAPVTPIAIAGNKTSDVLCKGGSTGSGIYTVSGNATLGAYTFTPTTFGTATLTQAGNVITLSNAAAGSYTVRVTDTATGCFADGTIVIGEPANALTITSATPTNVSCNNDNSTITILAAGGTPNYTYAAVVAATTAPTIYAASNLVVVDTNLATNLSWDVYVKDANGCVTMTNITIVSDPLPGLTVAVDNQCTGSGSAFTITAIPTAASLTPLTYGIGGPTGTFQMSPTFSVPAGTYTVSIKDKNGCITAASPIIVYPRLTAAAVVTKTLDCSSSPDAVITTTITGGRAPFTYTVQKGSGAPSAPSTASAAVTFTTTVSNANADTYTFVITDANGCTTTTTTTVAPITDPTVTATPINVSCNAGSDGSVTLTGAGGSGGYLYSNNATTGFTTNSTFTGLAAGTYTFYVQDSKGCVGSVVVNITEPTNALVATAVEVPFSCSVTNSKVAGTVTVNVTTGTGTAPYTYSFNGGAFTTNNVLTLNDNGADQPYTYTVRDARGCTISGSGTLERLNPPTDLTFVPSGPITCLVTAISVQLTTTNGVTPLTYTIVSGPVTNTSGATSGNFTGLTPGNYVFRVTDATGCYYSESYTIAPVTPIVATATKLTDVDCFGNTTGSIRYGVSGFGSGTYSYTVNGGTPVTGQTASTFTLPNLGANTYVVVFTDETTTCTAPTSVVINQPAAALSASYTTINANCNVPTSSVTVTVAGGTPSYRYSFVTSLTTPGTYGTSNIANLNPAITSWYAHIIDANNCTFILPITIAQDPIPNVTVAGSGCLGSGTYTITATGTGGVGTLTYSINNGASYQTGNTFIVTTAGNYTITVKDANGCTDTDTITVNPQLTLTAVLNKDITCSLPVDAQITLTPTGGSGSFTYAASPSTGTFSGAIFTTSTPDNYTFTVTDTTTACTYTTTTAIVISAPIDPDITGFTQTAFINCNGDDTGAIRADYNSSLGLAPFQFSIDGTTFQNSNTFTGLSAGLYTITIRDAKGCTDTQDFTILQPPPIVIEKTVVPIQCVAGSGVSKGSIIIDKITDGVSTVGGSGGTAPYTYYVTGINNYSETEANATGTTSVTFDVVDFGIYQIRVVDANGCTVIENDVLVASDPDDLDIDINSTVTCATGGTATVTVVGPLASSGPFHFNIYNGPGQVFIADGTAGWQGETPAGSKGTTFIGLLPGVTYTFIVYDEATLCYYYETAAIPIPSNSSLVIANLVPKNITCTGSADGNVSFDVTNSSGLSVDYTYEIFEAFTNVSQYLSGTFTVAAGSTVNVPSIPITLGVGSYYVYVRETSGPNAGCGNASANFNIQESPVLLTVTGTVIKNSNCTDDGIISAQAQFGTGPYTYQVTTSATPPLATDASWVPGNTFTRPGSLTGITYYVYAKDAYNCIQSDDVILFQDAPPTISVPAPICYDGTPFTIDLSTVSSASILPATYSVNGSAFQSSPSFTFNASGTYNLVIKDGNNCTATVPYEVYPQLVSSAAVTKPLDCTASPDATITITTTGGNPLPAPDYTYEVSVNGALNVAATNPYTATAAGTYVFTITDANNATTCTTTASITLDPIPTTVFNTTQTAVSCNGGADGTITVNVTAGEGPYEYQLDSGTFQTSNVFAGLSAGIPYVVTVRNAKQCLVSSGPITISEPAVLTATDAFTANTTCSPTTIITVTAAGGNGGYLYNFNGLGYTTDNTYTVNNLTTPTTVNYTVKDAKGCETASQAVITPALTPPTDLAFVVTTAPTCPANTATVQVTATGGLGALDFDIISFNGTATALYPSVTTAGSATPASFAGLPPGDYMFQVTDANGCTYQELYTIADVTPIAIVGALVNDITCNVANGTTNNGSASFTVTGASTVGGYSVSVAPPVPFTQSGNTVTLTGLSAGTYTVTVTDNTTLCVATDDVSITEPVAIAFTTSATKVFCSQDISQITISGLSGGTGAYTYAVVAGSATAPIAGAYGNNPVLSVDTDLINLSWDVYVKDANGCIAIQNVTVVSDAPPTIVAPAAQCFEGSPLTVDLSTLTTTYNPTKIYTLNGVVLASSTATFTAAGTYVLGIRDDNGCEAFVNYTIEEQVLANAILTKDLYCAGAVNATIDITITGGVAPYAVQTILNGTPTGVPATAVTGPVYTVSVATVGTYTFTITDSNAAVCDVTTNAVDVTTPATPAFTTTSTDATCNGDSNGTITVTPTAGVAPYTFDLSGTGSNTTGDANGFYTGLPAGSYTVVITDAKGCTSLAAAAITIAEPVVVSATISVTTALSCGAGNATQSATVTAVGAGGNGSYQYNFNNQGFTPSNTFVTNTSGTVSVIARDANGCTFATAVSTTVDALDPPTDMTFSSTPIYCAPASSTTSTVTIMTTDGIGPLAYAILSPASATGNTSGASLGVFTTLAPGDYMFQVTDANGCTYQELYTVADVIRITAAATATTDVTCFGLANGTATFDVSNFTGTYSYTFDATPAVAGVNSAQLTFSSLAPGPHTLIVTDDTTGCTTTVNMTITQPAAALDFTSTATNTNCSTDMATITVVASGGTLNYKYVALVAPSSAPLATAYGTSNTLVVDTNGGANMLWDVYVMDANGCLITKPQTIVLDASPVITLVVEDQCPSLTGTYTITVTATGFGTLQYSADGSNYQTGNVITVNAPGTYTISVKDVNGCITTATPVTIVDPLILTPTVTASPSCADGDGVIAVATTGGSGNYEYRIDSGVYPMTTPFTGIASGIHTIYVRDTTTGCEVSTTVTLQPATPITGFSLSTTPVSCNGGVDGTITATLATPAPGINDNPVYTYTLNGNTVGGVAVSRPSQNSPLFSGLAAGTYTVVVTSGRACTDTQTIDVLEPALIVVPAPTVVQFGCTTGNVGNLATITVTGVTGGTTPYLNYEFIKIGTPNTQVQFSTSNVYTEGNLLGGSYLVNVYDSKGCVGTTTAPITIAPYVALDKVNVAINQAITCSNLENITVTATTVGGTAPNLEYTLVDTNASNGTTGTLYPSQTNTTGIFTNLPVADYLITVRNLDTNCEIKGVHYVNDPNTFDLTIDTIVDVACFGATTGSANVTFIDRIITTTPPNGDDAGAFTYTLQDSLGNSLPGGTSPNAGPFTITGLAAGTYTITATLSQSPDCAVTRTFTIAGPSAALDLTESYTDITCLGNDGTISVAASGGWSGGYEYQLLLNGTEIVAYGAQFQFMNLSAGNYTVNVRDSKGCVDTVSRTLVNPTPITITATPATQALTCFGDKTASIQATGVSGGQGANYSYTLNYLSLTPVVSSGPQASDVFSGLGVGNYSITVTDGWNCSATSATVAVTEPTLVQSALVVSRSQTCTTLSQLTLSASGGTPPYTYSADDITYSTTPFASSVSFDVPVGTYRYFVKDANGCVAAVSNDIEIVPLETLLVNVDVANAVILCTGDLSGVIVADATGGLGNYTYTLLNGSGVVIVPAPTQLTPGRFTNLAAGFYQVRVDSGDCNAVSLVVEIREPAQGVTYTVNKTDVTCNGENNGRIEIVASGGTGSIVYSISPRSDQFFEDGIFENLAPGNYNIIIQDQNGCFEEYPFTITEPTLLTGSLQAGSLMPEVCAGDNDGAFSITVTGGVGPYSVSLDNSNGPYTQGIAGQTDFDFTNLAGGAHKVYIKDASDCSAELEVIMPDAVLINPQAAVTYDCINNTQANRVVVTYDASNDPADLDFDLDGLGNYQSSNTFDNVAPGSHFITVRHTNGCIQSTIPFTVDQVDPLVLVIDDGDLNQIKATATGGSGVYEYSFNGEDFTTESTYAFYQSGNYTVIVRDKYGCTATANRDFTYVDICIPNYFTPNGDGNLDEWAPGCTNNYPDLSFSIFDRYGRVIAKYRIGQKWDGKYNGEELPSGDYWYTLKLNNNKDDREFVGHFTLYR